MDGNGSAPDTKNDQDFRVNVKSKRIAVDQLTKYKNLLKRLLDGQPHLSEDDKEKLLQETLTNFELVVQENIVVDGLSWEEAAEDNAEDCEISTLDDILDEKIVQTTRKRNIYPKKILPYFVRCLKAERKLMELFENTVTPQEVKRDATQDAIMNNVSAAAPGMYKQASSVIKSLKALKQKAEGLHQVLDMQPSVVTEEAYREVFGRSDAESCPAQLKGLPANRYSIKRAVSEAEYISDYVPKLKIPVPSAETE